jgi:hypothetical protein
MLDDHRSDEWIYWRGRIAPLGKLGQSVSRYHLGVCHLRADVHIWDRDLQVILPLDWRMISNTAATLRLRNPTLAKVFVIPVASLVFTKRIFAAKIYAIYVGNVTTSCLRSYNHTLQFACYSLLLGPSHTRVEGISRPGWDVLWNALPV